MSWMETSYWAENSKEKRVRGIVGAWGSGRNAVRNEVREVGRIQIMSLDFILSATGHHGCILSKVVIRFHCCLEKVTLAVLWKQLKSEQTWM